MLDMLDVYIILYTSHIIVIYVLIYNYMIYITLYIMYNYDSDKYILNMPDMLICLIYICIYIYIYIYICIYNLYIYNICII